MKSLNVAAYGMDAMYSNLAVNLPAIQTAGWNSIMLGMFHPHLSGDVWFNNTQILSNGSYIGRPDWPSLLQKLTQGPGPGIRLAATVGGAPPWVDDFSNIQKIYQKNNKSFTGTLLYKNFKELFDKFPTIRLIDMDVEETYDQESFVAFCRMLIKIGFGITFCPFEEPFNNTTFWTGSLLALSQSSPGAVKWWNLQCYAGGARNKPQKWADAISGAIPGFNTTGFILASDWSRFADKRAKDPKSWVWGGDCPPAMQTKMGTFANQACVGGAFVWNIDQILGYANDQKQKPDPAPCGNVGMRDYVAAITNGLG